MNSSRVEQYDGLRGLAILAVVAGHVGLRLRYGGVVGVTAFFSLSGFLITGILAKELDRVGRVSFSNFYIRRFLRLGPALVVTVAATTVIVLLTHDPIIDEAYWTQAISAITYTSNLFMMTGDEMELLGHSWSLAVEEQFYLVWPIVLVTILTRSRDRRAAARTVGLIASAFLVWRLVAPLLWSHWERTYYGPDTNFCAMFLGAWLALVAVKHRDRVPGWAGYVAAGVLGLMAAFPQIDFEGVDRTITLYIGAATGVLSVVILGAATRMVLLRWRPLIFCGTISYGWYLWHQVLLELQPFGRDEYTNIPLRAAIAAIAFGVACASYWGMEVYFQRVKHRYERVNLTSSDESAPAGASFSPPVSQP